MKYIKFSLCFLVMFFLLTIDCFASVNTYTRTENNLLVPNDVVVTVDNMNDIIKTPAVSSSEKVYDYADLFTDNQEKAAYKKLIDYTNSTGIDAAIVTVKDLAGFTCEEYINNFYNYNDFMDDAVAFLIYLGPKEAEIYMIADGKGSKIYTDARIQQTLEYVYKDIDDENYGEALDDYINIVSGFYNKETGNYKVDKNGNIIQVIPWIEIAILSGALTFIVVMFLISKFGSKKYFGGSFYKKINPSTLMVKTDKDEEINLDVSNDN